MKILYSHYLTDDQHPAALMVDAVAAELRSLGHDVLVHRSAGPVTGGTAVRRVERRGTMAVRRALWSLKAMARNRLMVPRDHAVLKNYSPDVVLVRQDAYCLSMVRAATRKGVPIVTYADAPVAYETRQHNPARRWHLPGIVEAIERYGLARSRAVVTVSHVGKELLDGYGISAPIVVAPNGINRGDFPELSAEIRERRRLAAGLGQRCVIGFVGTFKAFHGIDLLRDLMLSTSWRDDVEWVLIGDGPERHSLEQAIGAKVRARFLGRLPHRETTGWLQLCDVAVAPHRKTNTEFYFCPLKILEAAAAGCACVASAQGDIPRLIEDGETGLLVRSDEFIDWSEALSRLISDAKLRQRLGAAARARILNGFTWSHTARTVNGAILQAIQRPGKA